MNILLDTLPETITVDGKEYFADTDFRTMIILEKIITNRDASDSASIVFDVVDLVLTDRQPDLIHIEETINEIMNLYSCGSQPRQKKKVQKNGHVAIKEKLIYDYEYDAPYIYGAFLSQYGVDLNDIDYLHWWKFNAMFRSLPNDCKIVEIMSYRATDLSKISDKNERNRIARLQNIYAIPDNLTTEDKIAMAGMAFGGMFV